MLLVLRAQMLQQASISPPIVGEFDERGGTIGRSDSNTMTLPDPERHVSRLQAEVTFKEDAFWIRNVGGSSLIIVNGRPLSPGEAVPMRHQDELAIGGYSLHVDLQSPSPRDMLPPAVDVRTVISASAGEERTGPPRGGAASAQDTPTPGDDVFANLLGTSAPAGEIDPFADLLWPMSRSRQLPSAPAPTPIAEPAPVAAKLPDDFDPFATSGPGQLSPHGIEPVIPASSMQDVLGAAAPTTSLDAAFELSGNDTSGAPDPVLAFLATPAATPIAASEDDPFAFLSGGAAAPEGPSAPDHTPELQAAFVPPPVRVPETLPRTEMPPDVAATPPESSTPADATVLMLWDAFREGAQLAPSAQVRLTPELMRLVGATLRHAVEGTLQLSATRTTVKQELHVPVTVIKPKGNNPLKFAPDASAALAQMMQPPMRGFMAAPEAMQDAMTDLLAHSVGTIEGTRAALQGMLRRFEPARLESQLASGAVFDKLLPMNRRARLWDLYLQHYERISEAAREDFDELFGKAFVKAYEAHAERVAAARRAGR